MRTNASRAPCLRRGLGALALALALAPSVLPAQEPVPGGARSLPPHAAQAESAALERMRAGAAADARTHTAEARSALERAAAAAPELAAMRAGGITLTDEEVRLILITAAVVIVLAILI
jgi:hypothetical protein